MNIEFVKDEDGIIIELIIDEESFSIEDYDGEISRFVVPMSSLVSKAICELPEDVEIELCDSLDKNMIVLHNIPIFITRQTNNRTIVTFEELITRKYWDGPIGLKLWMETKRDIINERFDNVGDIKILTYDDDGAYINLTYVTELEVETFDELFHSIDELYNEIEGATDIALRSPFAKIESCRKESDFSMKILLPLFRALGFCNVKYNHGNKEYGKDITFARKTEFDDYEFYGVQVKFGDVSGGVKGDIGEIISQVNDAFMMPFYDVYSRRKVRIAKMVVAISGKYTSNAIEKIIDGITDSPTKNNIIFLDGDKIDTLMERYKRF